MYAFEAFCLLDFLVMKLRPKTSKEQVKEWIEEPGRPNRHGAIAKVFQTHRHYTETVTIT